MKELLTHNNNNDNNNDDTTNIIIIIIIIIAIITDAITETEMKIIKEEEKLKLKRKEAVLYIIKRRECSL